MKRWISMKELYDPTLWIGKLSGYRVEAFGRAQVLNAPIEIHVRQAWINPIVWEARAYPGDHEPCAMGHTAEACMARAEALFVNVVEPWKAFREQPLFGRQQLKPELVKPAKRKAG